MRVFKFNGEVWYEDRRSWLKRIRQWVIWVGGIEFANGRGWEWSRWRHPAPVSLWGHAVTFYGYWASVRTPWGWLVITLKRTETGRVLPIVDQAFISRCGTPDHAHIWLVGAPPEIVRSVDSRAQA